MWGKQRIEGAIPVAGVSMINLELLAKLAARVTYIQKVQLFRVSSADARREKQQITLEP